MQYTTVLLCTAFAVSSVFSHALVTAVVGANGVNMPGLTVVDGTPRDCPSAKCGAQDDTSVIRANEAGTSKASAMGRTKANGPVTAMRVMSMYMDGAAANLTARKIHAAAMERRQLGGLLGGLGGLGGGAGGGGKAVAVKTPAGTKETGFAAAAGMGASNGLPTASDSGVITMTLHQCNQDGGGPFDARIDPTSGGTDVSAFQKATVTDNVPGFAAGLNTATTTDYTVKVQMPAGMTCKASMAGADNVCVVMLNNAAPAGPFGGAGVFTQSAAARKRAIEYNLAKRRFARANKALGQ